MMLSLTLQHHRHPQSIVDHPPSERKGTHMTNPQRQPLEAALAQLLDVDVEAVSDAFDKLSGLGYDNDINNILPELRINREDTTRKPPEPSRSNAPKLWMPSDQAMRTAKATVRLTDVTVHLARYRVVKAEKRQQPTSGEWLRWLFSDEERAIAAERKENQQKRSNPGWASVAE